MIRRYFDEERPLMVAGTVSLALAVILAVISVFDATEILGIGRWIKPIKFFISISIFVWTIGVLLSHLQADDRAKRVVSWSLIAIFVVEMAAIVGQAARGARSHFNFATAFDAAVYAVMGIAIGISTIVAAYVLFLYLAKPSDLPPTVVQGVRLGLGIFLIACLQGAYMSSGTGHAVGVSDGGPGLPFVNWSSIAGDLRVAHFFGLHSIQAVPIAALFIDRVGLPAPRAFTTAFAFLYLAFFAFVFWQALAGRPVL